jgi:hypothetical protein
MSDVLSTRRGRRAVRDTACSPCSQPDTFHAAIHRGTHCSHCRTMYAAQTNGEERKGGRKRGWSMGASVHRFGAKGVGPLFSLLHFLLSRAFFPQLSQQQRDVQRTRLHSLNVSSG